MAKIKALAVDLSSNNGDRASDYHLERHYAAGYRVLIPKATQAGYTWALGSELTRIWHGLGDDAVAWRYAFNSTSGTPLAQASQLVRAIAKTWRDGDRWCLDVEAIPTGGRVVPSFGGAQARQFCDRMHKAEPSWPGLIYGSPYNLRDRRIRPVHGEALWLADYASHIAFIPPGWTEHTLAAWQYTDRAVGVPGMPGAVDRSIVRPAFMPAAHAHKALGTPLKHRAAAETLLHALRHRQHPIEGGHGDRRALAELGHEIEHALNREAHK